TGEKPPAAPVFDFSSDDDLASDTPAHSDGDASTSSEVAHQRNDKSARKSPLIQSNGEVTVEKAGPPRTVLSDVGVIDERERIVEVVEEIVKQSEETIAEHLPHAKEVRISPPTASSNLDNSVSSPQVMDGHDRLNETNEETDAEIKKPDWMADFKAKLVERLSEVPTERIGEVHRMIRHEIDSLYAEQIANDIQTRFKDEEQDAVQKRVLSVITD
ncbi:unnamed protein product, partial [Toxocara canis]|uniref:DEK_C domain-containing protein n=1 Tax=Toxocara canis TaxID=6265 RepID=A0A183TZ20_TOXCA